MDKSFLLEREHDCAAIEGALGRAQAGDGQLVVIEGHAGIGKSALLRMAGRIGSEAGMTVLTARGRELERDFAFGVAVQLFESPLRDMESDTRAEVLSGAAAAAGPIMHGEAEELGGPEQATFVLVHALYWVAANLAERNPLLCIVDDAHWGDRPSLRFLAYVSQRLEGLPVAIALAVRRGEPGTPADLLGPLVAHPHARLRRPEPLSPGAAELLVASRMPGADSAFSQACARVTAGNPFLLHELLAGVRSAGARPDAATAARIGQLAPETVLASTLARLARLPSESSRLVRAVAVLGPHAHLRHAARIAGLELDVAARAADALVAAEILLDGDPLAFVHPLLHSTIYDEIPAAQCEHAHLEAALLLAAESTDPAVLAGHILPATRSGEAWVVEALRTAAQRALASGAGDSAAPYLRRALEEPPPAEARAQVLLELGEVEGLAGEAEAPHRLEEAMGLLSDPRERAAALLRLGWMVHKTGRVTEAAEVFERGVAELDGRDPALADELTSAYLGAAMLDAERADEARSRLASLLADEEPVEASRARRALLSNVAMGQLFAAEPHDRVRELARRVLAGGTLLAEEGPDSLTLWHAVGCLSWADDLELALETTNAALDEARRRGAVVAGAQAYYARCWPHYWMGRLDNAIADAQIAIDAWSGGWGMYLPVACHWLAVALIERGELERAAVALELDGLERWDNTPMLAMFTAARGLVASARGEAKQALEDLLAAGELFSASHIENPSVFGWRSHAAFAAARVGDAGLARRLVDEEIDIARRFGAARALGAALRAAGVIERGDRAVELLTQAAGVLEKSPAALEHARAKVDLGTALRRNGQRALAREPLREGLDMAARFGARPLEERARAELEASGARPRRRRISGADALTASERRVAEMAADGRTNREIAQALFVTVKAVQFHLRNAYRKLEVSSREELPGALGKD